MRPDVGGIEMLGGLDAVDIRSLWVFYLTSS